MAVDWVATLQEQTDLVMKAVKDVTDALDARNLTIDQASRLYRAVEMEPRTSIGLSRP